MQASKVTMRMLTHLPDGEGSNERGKQSTRAPVRSAGVDLSLDLAFLRTVSYCLARVNTARTSSYVTTTSGSLMATVAIPAIAFCTLRVKALRISLSINPQPKARRFSVVLPGY